MFSLALFLALVLKIANRLVCQQTVCNGKPPLTVLHQNTAWIETNVSHHGDISAVRGMDQIQVAAFTAMDERTGILTLPLVAASESPILLAAVKT